jgi:hypothetical protein
MMEPWQATLMIVGVCGLLYLGMRWIIDKLDRRARPVPSEPIHVYDKAKYHTEAINEFGLPDERAGHFGTFFLSWVIKRNLTGPKFERRARRHLALYRAGKISIQKLYFEQDSWLTSDMFNDEANAFALAYVDFRHGQYIPDFVQHLQKDLPSEFHVEYTQENERRFHDVIDRRYKEWKERAGAEASAAG